MYIMINDIIGEKRIDLSYPIRSGKIAPEESRSVEIAVISIFSNNVLYQVEDDTKVLLPTGEELRFQKGCIRMRN